MDGSRRGGVDADASRARASARGLGPRLSSALFVLALAPILLGSGLWIALGPVDPTRPLAAAAFLVASFGWWGALALARRVPDSFALGLILVVGALALRVAFLASTGRTSDDAYRYVWEGALIAEGRDPYALAPNAPELEPERERWSELAARVNHPEVPAAYPPLAQGLHALVVTLAGGAEHPARALFGLRLVQGTADLLVLLPLALLLRRQRRPLAWLATWAWNPWIAQEFAGAAHLDAVAILLALAGLAAAPRHGPLAPGPAARAALALAGGALVKLAPLAFAPFVLRRAHRPVGAALVLVGAFALGMAGYAFALGAWPRLHGLGEYAFRWESFNLVHRGLEPLFGRNFEYDESWSDPRRLARALTALAWLALAAHAWRRRFGPARAAGWLAAAFVVLTPTLHPWYLAWIVPFLALRPSLPFAAFAGLAPLLYWPLARWRAEGVWHEPTWLHPCLAGLLVVLWALERRRPRP